MTIEAGTSANVSRAFVMHQLVPKLNKGDIVVMDNSPEFNPIEKAWAKMKENAFQSALAAAMETISK